MPRNPFESHWDKVRARRAKLTNSGAVTVTVSGTRLHIIAPYHPTAAAKWRELEGKWRPRSRCWSVAAEKRTAVVSILSTCYGEAVPEEWRA